MHYTTTTFSIYEHEKAPLYILVHAIVFVNTWNPGRRPGRSLSCYDKDDVEASSIKHSGYSLSSVNVISCRGTCLSFEKRERGGGGGGGGGHDHCTIRLVKQAHDVSCLLFIMASEVNVHNGLLCGPVGTMTVRFCFCWLKDFSTGFEQLWCRLLLFRGWSTSQIHVKCISQTDLCCHTDLKIADKTYHFIQ